MSETSTLHCAICGAAARPAFHAPRPPEIAPDLDMRPGEPVRSTLRDWLQACGTCHAAGPDLSALPAGTVSVVMSVGCGSVKGCTRNAGLTTAPAGRLAAGT